MTGYGVNKTGRAKRDKKTQQNCGHLCYHGSCLLVCLLLLRSEFFRNVLDEARFAFGESVSPVFTPCPHPDYLIVKECRSAWRL
ncbi:hypothetical protein MATL_G00108910 [Megalops atlanticus]|uniref:Uncharacterized protein n=1 Tax=Megalops atlanticus TaxID=7932 RepID=A0A9D3Q4G9_MEGAT|nr:hypothetical protein MATL_G00108910 [Megalops atlanticus]